MESVSYCGVELEDYKELVFIGRLEAANEYVITDTERMLFCKAVHDAYMWGKKIDEENKERIKQMRLTNVL